MDIFTSFFTFFTDKTKSWSHKTVYTVTIIIVLLVIDLIFKFSYNYQTSKKLSQLESISKLKISYKNDSVSINKLTVIENEIMTQRHYTFYVNSLIETLNPKNSKAKNSIKNKSNFSKEQRNLTLPQFDIYWMIISSNTFLIIVEIILIFLPFFGYSENRKLKSILNILTSLFFIGLFILLFTWLMYQLPIINKHKIYYNYILNFLIQVVFITLLGVWGNMKDSE